MVEKRESSRLPAAPACISCRFHGTQNFPDGFKTVCIYNPPTVFGIIAKSAAGDPVPIYETVYPVPPFPCSKWEPITNGHNVSRITAANA